MATTKLNNGQLPTTLSSKTIDSSNTINTDLTKLSITGGTNGQVLSTNGSGSLSWATVGGVQTQVDTFTSSGTWTKPAWAKRVDVYLLSGGCGGNSGGRRATTTTRTSGAGGTAGTITYGTFNASSLGSTESITIGAGGTGGASVTTNDTAGNFGTVGGRTLFGSHFQAPTTVVDTVNPASPSTVNTLFSNQTLSHFLGIQPPLGGVGNTDGGAAQVSDFQKAGGGGAFQSANITTTKAGRAASSSYSNGSTFGYYQTQTTGTAGGTNGGNGSDGTGSVTAFGVLTLGNGGGGGSYATGQATGRGGHASNYGAGGGGGAASDNGFASGAGGNGSGGMAVVISIG